jgi:NADPH:quinone reductase-like Zn-dependent oxidoreductase
MLQGQRMPATIPRTMSAVLLTGHGDDDTLAYRRDVAVPLAATGEVLIRVGAAGVNNTDINTRLGWYAATEGAAGGWSGAVAFPRIQGADVCGTIVAAGAGVPPARIGERVLVQPCLRSLARDGQDQWLGSERDGGFAQYVAVPAADTYRVDCDLTDVELASFPCCYATAENLLTRSAVAAGERVLVTGASGGVGSAAVQLAVRRGARVVAVAAAGKAAACLDLGAAAVVARDAELAAESFDVVIDVVGGDAWPRLLDALRPRGRYAVSGAIAGPHVALDLRALYLKDLTLFGCTSHDDGVFAHLIGYIERREIRPVVARAYPLADLVTAQRDFLAKRHVGKLVVVPPD